MIPGRETPQFGPGARSCLSPHMSAEWAQVSSGEAPLAIPTGGRGGREVQSPWNHWYAFGY